MPSSPGGGTDAYGRLIAQALAEQLKQSFVVDNKPGASGPSMFYGTAGVGSPLYIGVRMLEAATGAQFNHVPYKGVGPADTDLLAGRLQFMLTDLASVRHYIDTGKLLALAITDKSALLPAAPSFAEAGYGGIKAFTAFSVLVPAKTPPTIVRKLASEIARAMKNPATLARLDQLALLPVADTPEQFAASLKEEQAMWGSFIRQHNITPE